MACCLDPWSIRLPSSPVARTSGYLRTSQTGGVAVDVHKMTFRLYFAASCSDRSSHAKSYWPSVGSSSAHANSAKWVNSKPIAAMFLKSRSH